MLCLHFGLGLIMSFLGTLFYASFLSSSLNCQLSVPCFRSCAHFISQLIPFLLSKSLMALTSTKLFLILSSSGITFPFFYISFVWEHSSFYFCHYFLLQRILGHFSLEYVLSKGASKEISSILSLWLFLPFYFTSYHFHFDLADNLLSCSPLMCHLLQSESSTNFISFSWSSCFPATINSNIILTVISQFYSNPEATVSSDWLFLSTLVSQKSLRLHRSCLLFIIPFLQLLAISNSCHVWILLSFWTGSVSCLP